MSRPMMRSSRGDSEPLYPRDAGYAPIMPTYQGQVSEEGLIDLVEYIKNLNSNYRIQQTLTASQLSPGQAGASSSGPARPQ